MVPLLQVPEMNKIVTNHLLLPGTCRKCGEKNEYWLDGTFGCKNGHIYAHLEDPKLDYSFWVWGEPQSSGDSTQ